MEHHAGIECWKSSMCIVGANGKIVKETNLVSETGGLLRLSLPTDGLESCRLLCLGVRSDDIESTSASQCRAR
jgi:hypothetical protein